MRLSKQFRFEASHQLHNHPGKCSNLHGHSWILTVTIEGEIDPETGMVRDYGDIKDNVQPIVDQLDHTHLGSGWVQLAWIGPTHVYFLPSLPTSENMLVWIANQLREEFPWISLTLNETCTTAAELTRADWNKMQGRKENDAVNDQAEGQKTAQAAKGAKKAQRRKDEVSLEITDSDIPF
jgi:6-pyruvoyltetrahydropterin/6-carboxytetrahydropterin synthase